MLEKGVEEEIKVKDGPECCCYTLQKKGHATVELLWLKLENGFKIRKL